MLCAYAASQSFSDPLSGLVIGQRPDPVARPGWSLVTLAAAGLNHHDVWSLQGVGLAADRHLLHALAATRGNRGFESRLSPALIGELVGG